VISVRGVARRQLRLLRRALGLAPARRRPARKARTPAPPRRPTKPGPNDPGGTRRIHVGCGPKEILPDWWNVDIRAFPGIDEVVDATKPWPWSNVDAVFGEHFLEHLPVEDALTFLELAAANLRPGGVLRLSTPSLEWVWATHFALGTGQTDEARIADTYRANRAFHGWGHRFLFSKPILERLLLGTGFERLTWHAYGESDEPTLRNLERHGGYQVADGWPSVWIVEAVRGAEVQPPPADLRAEVEQEFGRYVRSGH
jgi:predicted SAM-dependent methyltransferase